MNVKVREALLSDLKDIHKIEVESFSHPYPYELLLLYKYLSPKFFLVAEAEGKIVGYTIALIKEKKVGHILSIAVKPEFRGKGIGKLLLQFIENKLKEAGVKKIRLEVSVRNNVAINLYKKFNYKITNIIKNYYPDGSDAYIMEKEIGN